MSDLEIHVLGKFAVTVDGKVVEEQRWLRKKARLLIKLLAISPGKKLHREQLIDILWPEAEPDLGLNNLHKVIHAARRALEPELSQGATSRFLLTQDFQVALAQACLRIDADEFEALANKSLKTALIPDLEAALSAYAGDLLEEDLYEDWASVPRERLRLLYQQALECLGKQYEATHDPRCVEVLNRLLTISPSNEQAHQLLMRFYAGSGRRDLALNQYRLCCESLKRELGTNPEGATVRLHEKILAGEVGATESQRTEARPTQGPQAVPEPDRSVPKSKFATARFVLPVLLATLAVITVIAAITSRFLPGNESKLPLKVAILPLQGRGGGDELEYAADGITDGLINWTSRLPGIRVMARATVFSYKGRHDLLQIGRELKVDEVLNGRVTEKDGAVTVELELIDVSDGSRKWGRLYTLPRQQMPTLQQLLNSDLAHALKANNSGLVRDVDSSGTVDPQAYRSYMIGRHLWNQRTAASFLKSIEYFQQAIERDRNYALAYAGLADSYGLLGFNDAAPEACFPKARDAATKALDLDPSLAEAQTSLAMISALYDWNWPVAEAQFKRAISMNPGYSTAHHWFGVHLCAMGRFDEGRKELETALNLDPLSPPVNENFGFPAFYQHHYPEAAKIFQRTLEIDTNFAPAHEDLMTIFDLQGDSKSASREAVLWLQSDGKGELAGIVKRDATEHGYRIALSNWLHSFEAKNDQYVSPMAPAKLSVRLGKTDEAFFWFDKAVEQRSPELVYLGVDPLYDSIRSDPRFKRILQRVGLTK